MFSAGKDQVEAKKTLLDISQVNRPSTVAVVGEYW